MYEFRRPVIVQPGRLDRDRVVRSTAEAARMLLHEWPATEGRRRREAMRACLRTMQGRGHPILAREAFIAAAREVRIFLGDGDANVL